MKKDLSKKFARFAGREVKATEHKHTYTSPFDGKTEVIVEVKLDDADPVRALRASLVLVGGDEERARLAAMWGPSSTPAAQDPRSTP